MTYNAQHATVGHQHSLVIDPAPPLIAEMIRALVPSGKRKAIIALFEHRTTFNTIKGWRKGRRRAPQWALDICSRRMAPILQLAERGRTERGAMAGNYAPNIRAWHARQKEKAGDKPAS